MEQGTSGGSGSTRQVQHKGEQPCRWDGLPEVLELLHASPLEGVPGHAPGTGAQPVSHHGMVATGHCARRNTVEGPPTGLQDEVSEARDPSNPATGRETACLKTCHHQTGTVLPCIRVGKAPLCRNEESTDCHLYVHGSTATHGLIIHQWE